jgi:hypothetical protein
MAGISLISPSELNTYVVGDSAISYVRVPSVEQARLVVANTPAEARRKLLLRAIKGWKGLQLGKRFTAENPTFPMTAEPNGDGAPTASDEQRETLVNMLPDAVAAAILFRINAAGESDDVLGN